MPTFESKNHSLYEKWENIHGQNFYKYLDKEVPVVKAQVNKHNYIIPKLNKTLEMYMVCNDL